ncbi:histidine--tRNA ligase, partial [Candidatus Parvarchaeota archaeon]|nr:histidine--tRNA ligase [Candidatus Parvarchaeota archaeon]
MDYSTPKGMRDYLPAQMELREALLDKIRAVFRSYGFRPLDTPAIETVATLQKQGGEEIEGQIFRIQESDLGLRYDLTVPLARVCGSNSFSLPFKRYAISKVWRREEPQKGRLREFIQSDIDTIGSSSPKCEAELLACAAQCLKALGFANFEMRLNSRALLDSYFDRLGINAQRRTGVMRAIDKIGKLDMGKIQELLEDATGDKKAAQGLLDFISLKGNAAVLKEAKKLGLSETAISNLEQILEYCRMFGISPVLDMSLVRGLAYYTGAVFEISASKEIGSVAGGGRYDNLVGTYGPAQPAVGISLGFERLFAL